MEVKFSKIAVFAGIAIAVLVQGCVPLASAATAPELYLSDGTNSVTVDSTGVIATTGHVVTTVALVGTPGVITWDGCLGGSGTSCTGGLTTNVTTGTTKPASVAPAIMDLNSINVDSGGADTLTIEWSDSGFNLPGGFLMIGGGTAAATSTMTYTAYVNSNNALLGTTSLLGTISGSGGVVSGTVGGAFLAPAGPYSLTEKLVMSFTAAGQDSGDFSLNTVPEPASVTLLGGAVLGIVAVIRRRAKRA
jgi:hypothetical protein